MKHSNYNIESLLINLPKLNRSLKIFKKVNYVSFMVNEKHKNIFYKYSDILNRIAKLIGKYFIVEVILKTKYITTKIKSYNNEIKKQILDGGLPTK